MRVVSRAKPARTVHASRDLRSLVEAVAKTKRLSDQLDGYCLAAGRDPASIRRSVQALHPVPDPFSSLDAFDEYVGTFAEIGIGEVIFYWPPIDLAFADPATLPSERQARFEHIATFVPYPSHLLAQALSGISLVPTWYSVRRCSQVCKRTNTGRWKVAPDGVLVPLPAVPHVPIKKMLPAPEGINGLGYTHFSPLERIPELIQVHHPVGATIGGNDEQGSHNKDSHPCGAITVHVPGGRGRSQRAMVRDRLTEEK
jgi:hypothetical protein